MMVVGPHGGRGFTASAELTVMASHWPTNVSGQGKMARRSGEQ
jgi:hypothetical protein